MTDFEVVKKMIKKIEDRDIEIDCLGAFQTITIDYVVLEFEDEKLIDIWKYWEIPRLFLGIFYHRPGAPLYTKYLKKNIDF